MVNSVIKYNRSIFSLLPQLTKQKDSESVR